MQAISIQPILTNNAPQNTPYRENVHNVDYAMQAISMKNAHGYAIQAKLLCQYRHQFLHLFCHIISFIPQFPPFHFHSITTSISPSIPAYILAHNFLHSSISSIECQQYRLQFLLLLELHFQNILTVLLISACYWHSILYLLALNVCIFSIPYANKVRHIGKSNIHYAMLAISI